MADEGGASSGGMASGGYDVGDAAGQNLGGTFGHKKIKRKMQKIILLSIQNIDTTAAQY